MSKAAALDFLIDFEGFQNDERVLNYYDGGLGSLGSGPGPDYNITFNSNTRATKSSDFVLNPPSGVAAASFVIQGIVLNAPDGLIDELSFFYSSKNQAGNFTIYDGLAGTGNILKSVTLPPLDNSAGQGDPFKIWQQVNVSFDGVAKSLQFSSLSQGIVIDNIEVTAVNPIPEPLTILGSATAVGFGAFFKRHLSKQSPPNEEL